MPHAQSGLITADEHEKFLRSAMTTFPGLARFQLALCIKYENPINYFSLPALATMRTSGLLIRLSGNVTSNMPPPNISGAAVQKSFRLFSPFLRL